MPRDQESTKAPSRLLADSGLFDAAWYTARHGFSGLCGKDPWEHFLSVGWPLGRDPGPGFDTRAYLARYADVSESHMDGLSHFLFHGAAEGREPIPLSDADRVVSDILRSRLNVFGQQSALQKLQDFATDHSGNPAGFAGRDVALWYLRQWRQTGQQDCARNAGDWAQAAIKDATDPTLQSRLLTVMLIADAILGKAKPSDESLEDWNANRLISADTWLALAAFEPTPDARLDMINRALAVDELSPLTLGSEPANTTYDRLGPLTAPENVEGPLVSVLIAAFQAEDSIQTAIRAMAEQSWRSLEILVIDDASSDRTAELVEHASLTDPRVKLLQLPQNIGAYGARNAGLAIARGEFVTLHDADDWCHPERIAKQMDFMKVSQDAIACTSEHVRIHSDLSVTRISPEAHFLTENTASLLFRREPVINAFGCWDEVRVAADNELIRRIRRVFGADSVKSLKTGPLAMLRDREGSAVRTGPLAIDGYVTGARLAYLDTQENHHRRAHASDLRYQPGQRPFPAPRLMQGRSAEPYALSLILAADFRRSDQVTEFCIRLIAAADGPVGLLPLARPLAPDYSDLPFRLCNPIRDVLNGESVVQICPGEAASTPLLIVPDPESLIELPGPLPKIEATTSRVLAFSPPVSILPGTGRHFVRYSPATCEVNLRRLTDGSAEWFALNHGVRSGLSKAGATSLSRRLLENTKPWELVR
ncbi:glycosyltransferase family 2 protein [Nioella aestuarii]|uniref:glycosyltransferase family 2 protein n=1 Tax=Nioella aestuarii TaxID=1662864 RepID=UPI003D7F35D7